MPTVYKVKQKGLFPFFIRLFYTITKLKKCSYNHVLIKSKDYYYEMDMSVPNSINKFHELMLNKEWELKECFTISNGFHDLDYLHLEYSQWANFRYVLVSIPLLGKLFKKMWKPSRTKINCSGFIALLSRKDEYFDYHPQDF